jgi:hypothetical protein
MRKTKSEAERFWCKVDRRGPDECWEWQAARSEHGYGAFGLTGFGSGKVPAHRWSYAETVGPIPDGMHVCHRCDNPPCVNPQHLFVGTLADNMRDMVEKGRSLKGERHNLAQLTEAQVLAIRQAWADGGETQTQIAERFNTNKANVSQIVRGKKWKHLLPADWVAPTRGKWSRA